MDLCVLLTLFFNIAVGTVIALAVRALTWAI